MKIAIMKWDERWDHLTGQVTHHQVATCKINLHDDQLAVEST